MPPGYKGDLSDVCCGAQQVHVLYRDQSMEIVFSEMTNAMVKRQLPTASGHVGKLVQRRRKATQSGFVCMRPTCHRQEQDLQAPRKLYFNVWQQSRQANRATLRLVAFLIPRPILFLFQRRRGSGGANPPLFQTANYVGGALAPSFNHTTSEWVDSTAYLEKLTRLIFLSTGRAPAKSGAAQSRPTQTQTRASTTVESRQHAASNCATNNHRGAINTELGETIIPIPGLYPRWMDINQGAEVGESTAGSCLNFDGGNPLSMAAGSGDAEVISNWKTHGDRFGVDIYNWGGGVPPFSQFQAKPNTAVKGTFSGNETTAEILVNNIGRLNGVSTLVDVLKGLNTGGSAFTVAPRPVHL